MANSGESPAPSAGWKSDLAALHQESKRWALERGVHYEHPFRTIEYIRERLDGYSLSQARRIADIALEVIRQHQRLTTLWTVTSIIVAVAGAIATNAAIVDWSKVPSRSLAISMIVAYGILFLAIRDVGIKEEQTRKSEWDALFAEINKHIVKEYEKSGKALRGRISVSGTRLTVSLADEVQKGEAVEVSLESQVKREGMR